VLDQLPNTQKFDKEARETLLDVFRDAAEFWAEKKVPFRVFYSFEEPQSLQSVGGLGRGRLNSQAVVPAKRESMLSIRIRMPDGSFLQSEFSMDPRLRGDDGIRGDAVRPTPSLGLQCALMKNIVILISGRGSNMEAIVRAREAQQWPARIAAVISNKPDAQGLAFAQAHGIPTAVVDHKAFASREAFDAALQQTIDGFRPTWWCWPASCAS
jgi:hypothetical protein